MSLANRIALVLALPLAAVLAVTYHFVTETMHTAAFSKVEDSQPALTIAQVENLMGQPASIEQSASNDQTITGAVYHYPTSTGADMKVVFVNGVVFKAEFVSGAKS